MVMPILASMMTAVAVDVTVTFSADVAATVAAAVAATVHDLVVPDFVDLVVLIIVLVVEGLAIQAPAIENLPFFIDGDRLEQFLLVTLSPACHTFTSFRPGGGQVRFRNDRSGAVEI